MSDLESILKNFCGEKAKIFKKNGDFTEKGYKAYTKLIQILYDVESITGNFNVSSIVDELDKIADFRA
jgi:hypothetical protein